MEKYLLCRSDGHPTQEFMLPLSFSKHGKLFVTDDSMEKVAAAEFRPEIQEVVKTLKPVPGKIFVLVVPLSAGEAWSSNSNGDYFPEKSLLASYKTFESHGRAYSHHQNKDPNISYGRFLMASYNPRMMRVETIGEYNTEKNPRVCRAINDGERVYISMGIRVPYDICSKCGHISRSKKEYCDCLRTMMNKVFPDGTKVYAINPAGIFHDVSDVIVPADKTAMVLCKIGSVEVPFAGMGSATLAERLGIA